MAGSREIAVEISDRLGKLFPMGRVPIGAAQRFVKLSAYWFGHPQGPTRAPKHYERVVMGRRGWEIEFGANRFLVEVAIGRCVEIARGALESWLVTGQRQSLKEINSKMVVALKSSVANMDGQEYPTLYPVSGGHMHFGTQSIHTGDFVNVFMEMTGLSRILQ